MIDTVFKRSAATLTYPHAKGVWPAGSVDRIVASWIYAGFGAAGPTPGTPELRTLTTHRSATVYTIRRSGSEYTSRRR